MAFFTVARKVNFSANVMGNVVPVHVSIENTYKSSIDFTLFGNPYSFVVEKWARRGLTAYLTFFHSFTPRDMAQFGLRTEDASGAVNFYEDDTDIVQNVDGSYTIGPAKAMTIAQKLNCIERGCRDVISCLGQIGEIHQRSMMEYAVWFRENFQIPSSYSDFISLVTCHCIVHNDFMVPNIVWTVVKFH